MKSKLWPQLPTLAAKLAALEQAPVATLWVDEEGVIGYVNHRFGEVLGYTQEDILGTSLERLLPSIDIGQWRQEWWQILLAEGTIPVFPLTWRHLKGVAMECTASVSLVAVSGLQFAMFYLWPKTLSQPELSAYPTNDATIYLRNLGESVCLLDALGAIQFVNKAFCRLVGGAEADLLGQPLLEIVSPAKTQLVGVWEVLTQQRTDREYEFVNLAGKALHVRMTVVQLPGNGILGKYLVSFIDITEQNKIARQLETQNASYERLAANVPGFIYKFRMTPNGEFSFPYASRGCKEIFGVEPASVANDAMPIVQTIHPDYLQGFQDSVLASAISLTPWNFEGKQMTSDGEWKWFHAASRPQLQDNGDIIWEGLVMDVTARKKVEEELAAAKQAAELSASAKAEFLANMSHEIRTPLNAIIGLNRLVLKSELTPVQRDYLNKVQMSSENLLGIINNILDFSKIEQNKLVIEHIDFNLDSVLENIGTMLEPVAAEKGLDLLIDRGQGVPLHMIGDPLRLVQVLTNLCSNAIKFTERGEVVISVQKVSGDAGDKLRFAVKDTGIGMTAEQKGKVFESFTQADSSTTRHYGGTGLGLTICKHLTELMGGDLGVNSIVSVGSEFYFTLPLDVVPDSSHTPVIPQELEGWHVLLVMENPTACDIFQKMLHDLRFKVTVCPLQSMTLADILKQHEAAEQVPHELVLLDWKMTEEHKEEVIKALGSQAFGSQTPIIINISSVEVEQIKTISDSITNITYLNKPSTPSCLMDAILNASGKDALIETVMAKHDSKNLAFYEASVRGARILVVEDNEINQTVVMKTLESAEVIVDIVNNGQEAVTRLDQAVGYYDAVLMDLQMPVMDGYEATKHLRQDRRFDELPIIAMTAHTIAADRQKCLAVGMQDHVGKPIEPEQLFSALAKWTAGRPQRAGQPAVTSEQQSEPLPPPPAGLATVDMKAALSLLQGDEALLRRLLVKFAEEQQGAAMLIESFMAAGEWQAAADKTHQIKGVAGNLKINAVFETAKQLEPALRAQEDLSARKLLADFTAAMAEFIDEIQLCNTSDQSDSDQAEPVGEILLSGTAYIEINRLFDQLIGFLETNNWDAEDCLEQIDRHLGDTHHHEIIRIKDQLVDLEFEAAAEKARNMKARLHEYH